MTVGEGIFYAALMRWPVRSHQGSMEVDAHSEWIDDLITGTDNTRAAGEDQLTIEQAAESLAAVGKRSKQGL